MSLLKRIYRRDLLVCWNDNGPVTVVSNVHEDLPLITVKCWDSSAKNHIKIDCPYSITKYIQMGAVDSLDALVSLYQVDVYVRNSTGTITLALLIYLEVQPSKF